MVEKKDPVESAIDKLKPAMQQLSFGSVMGYCSGMAMKKIGKAVAFAVGVGFIAIQSAVHGGYIEVDWNKVKNDTLVKKLDTTGDGKLNEEDVKEWWKKLRALLTHKIPDATGFSMGFLFGVRYG